MMYYDEMLSKYGFNDGNSTPTGIEKYRQVYITVVNRLCQKLGSNVRVVAYDRPGVHNGCMILPILIDDFIPLPYENRKGEPLDGFQGKTYSDEMYEEATIRACELFLDDYINVQVTVANDALEEFLVNELGDD